MAARTQGIEEPTYIGAPPGYTEPVVPAELRDELLLVARSAGLEIRNVEMRRKNAGPGGLCTLNGEAVLILNQRASAIEQATVLGDALAGRDLTAVAMPSYVRGFIAMRQRARSRLLVPERRPGPGVVRGNVETFRRRRGDP
ncbi:MAG TPA: hypothetical protein VFQ61_09490 [Polyangiaceae bacterium]|nr:hypothetical protein [Polyangiaceae bacterium]